MAFDSVGASGHLAPPIELERTPRVLLQAGIGDAEVTTIAAELLSRAFHASLLPNNPRQKVFGLPLEQPANDTYNGPRSALTEILYKRDKEKLPDTNIAPRVWNGVHLCVRQEKNLQYQIVNFINTGYIIDPCEAGTCIKEKADCF